LIYQRKARYDLVEIVYRVMMNHRDTTPEQRLDLVVCDQQQQPQQQHHYYQNGQLHPHPGVIRPIPGRPPPGRGHHSNGLPPPVPGPKPVNYMKGMDPYNNQYNGHFDGDEDQLQYSKELSNVQRQLFPPTTNDCEVYNVHMEMMMMNGNSGNGNNRFKQHQQQPTFSSFGHHGGSNGFCNGYPRPTSNLKPMRKQTRLIVSSFFGGKWNLMKWHTSYESCQPK
jgi:hypothetical protein